MLVVNCATFVEARRQARRSPTDSKGSATHGHPLEVVAAGNRGLLEREWVRHVVQRLGRPGSDDPTDVEGGLFHVLVLPDPEDPPSQGVQMSVGLTIPLDVAREFRRPPRCVVHW